MKLNSTRIQYSSIVGGGLGLIDADSGIVKFQIMLIGTTKGISKAQNDAITQRLGELINIYGLEI